MVAVLIDTYPLDVQETVLAGRALILEMLPGCVELVDVPSKIIGYGYGSKYADLIVALAPFTNHVNLMFSRGVDLADPEGRLEGTGKKARHVKLHSNLDVSQPAVRALLAEALELFKAGRSK